MITPVFIRIWGRRSFETRHSYSAPNCPVRGSLFLRRLSSIPPYRGPKVQMARSFRRRVEKDQPRSVCEQRLLASEPQSHVGEAATHRMWQPLDSNHHPQGCVRDVGFPKRDIFSALVVPLWRCGATFYINLSSSTKMQRITDLKKGLGILCRSKKGRDHFGGRIEDFSAQWEIHVIGMEGGCAYVTASTMVQK